MSSRPVYRCVHMVAPSGERLRGYGRGYLIGLLVISAECLAASPCKPVVAVLRDSLGIRHIIVLSCVADCCEVERYVLTTIKRIIIIIIIIK